jgi:hypothetical protein
VAADSALLLCCMNNFPVNLHFRVGEGLQNTACKMQVYFALLVGTTHIARCRQRHEKKVTRERKMVLVPEKRLGE